MNDKELVRRFTKRRLLDIANELEIKNVTHGTHVYKIVKAIRANLEDPGIPEVDEMSDDLYDLTIALGLIDEDGELIESTADADDGDVEEDTTRPPCYGQGDDKDPACKKCPILAKCLSERKRRRPACYGVLHNATAEECDICIYFKQCKAAMTAEKSTQNGT